jgi:hypothetical protein
MRSAPRSGGIEQLPEVAAVERDVLGYPRGDAELRWIRENREGYLYRRRRSALRSSAARAPGRLRRSIRLTCPRC